MNDGISIDDAHVSYQTLDGVIDHILILGRNALLCKLDIAHAYRNVPVHPSTGTFWE